MSVLESTRRRLTSHNQESSISSSCLFSSLTLDATQKLNIESSGSAAQAYVSELAARFYLAKDRHRRLLEHVRLLQ